MKTQLRLLLVPNPCSLAGVLPGLASVFKSALGSRSRQLLVLLLLGLAPRPCLDFSGEQQVR